MNSSLVGACLAVPLLLLAAAAPVAAPMAAPVADEPHDPTGYLGTSRILLVFSPSGTDAELTMQRRNLRAQRAGMSERDLVLVTVIGGSAEPAARQLRRRYDAPEERFAALLIGKDGGTKLRAAQALSASRLFEVVDAMPMRRLEMR